MAPLTLLPLPQIQHAEHSSQAAKKLANEVQALQRKLAGVLKKQLSATAALQAKLDKAAAECSQLRDQLGVAEQKVCISGLGAAGRVRWMDWVFASCLPHASPTAPLG